MAGQHRCELLPGPVPVGGALMAGPAAPTGVAVACEDTGVNVTGVDVGGRGVLLGTGV
jgi:hypothetical protein